MMAVSQAVSTLRSTTRGTVRRPQGTCCMLVPSVRVEGSQLRGSCASPAAAITGAAENRSGALGVVATTASRNCAGRLGAAAIAIVSRIHVLLRWSAEVGEPVLLPCVQSSWHPGPDAGCVTPQPDSCAADTACASRRADWHCHCTRRGRRWRRGAPRLTHAHCGTGWRADLVELVSCGELPHEPVLHRLGHRLHVCMATAHCERWWAVLCRRADHQSSGGASIASRVRSCAAALCDRAEYLRPLPRWVVLGAP